MSMQSAFASAQVLPCNAQLEALKVQFGSVVASRILEAEAADFHWRARVKERYVGQHLDDDFGIGEELSRMAIVSDLDGHWHALGVRGRSRWRGRNAGVAAHFLQSG